MLNEHSTEFSFNLVTGPAFRICSFAAAVEARLRFAITIRSTALLQPTWVGDPADLEFASGTKALQ